MLNNHQFEDDSWDTPLDQLPPLRPISERTKRIIDSQRPDASSYRHPQDALHDQKLFDAKVSKHGDDPDALQASVSRGRPYREEKKVREQLDLEQSWPYMDANERMQHARFGGEDQTGKFLGQRKERLGDEGRFRYAPEDERPSAFRRGAAYALAGMSFLSAFAPQRREYPVTPIHRIR